MPSGGDRHRLGSLRASSDSCTNAPSHRTVARKRPPSHGRGFTIPIARGGAATRFRFNEVYPHGAAATTSLHLRPCGSNLIR